MSKFVHALMFESFGVRVEIRSNASEAIKSCEKLVSDALPNCCTFGGDGRSPDFTFKWKWNSTGRDTLSLNDQVVVPLTRRKELEERLVPKIRLLIAEFAREVVFVHAGVVVWKGKAILFPGNSMAGKTTLVAEFVNRGAEYYSDEYAILDAAGRVHPFEKTLSIREHGSYEQREVSAPVANRNGEKSSAPVRLVFITSYSPAAPFKPKYLSAAQGVLELINHTIPIRENPGFAMQTLKKVALNATFTKTLRGEAAETVEHVLQLLN